MCSATNVMASPASTFEILGAQRADWCSARKRRDATALYTLLRSGWPRPHCWLALAFLSVITEILCVASSQMTSCSEMEDQCAASQMQEFEFLQSMYSPAELSFSHTGGDSMLQPSGITLKLNVEGESVNVEIRVPKFYPYADAPAALVRAEDGTFDCDAMNSELRKWISEQQLGVPLIAEIASWLLENCVRYRKTGKDCSAQQTSSSLTATYSRYFILSHHLYSSTKRSDILTTARKLHLTGFSTPGKPAVIVVEGETNAYVLHADTDKKFMDFREIVPSGGGNAMSDVKQLLSERELGDKFDMLYNM
ncbi:unnamed protein product [Cylicocyclus nassatus]|uniref:RWD domain-containing protein n=1 Tax=Cylicocyclus nassatus TaxID=53992 RepID=A0AA36GUH2_CYLNA|nr:unnamed protein product [Cylicocyclus nassatus]